MYLLYIRLRYNEYNKLILTRNVDAQLFREKQNMSVNVAVNAYAAVRWSRGENLFRSEKQQLNFI